MRYLYQPGELEGGTKRSTDPIWSLKVYQIERNVTKPNEPVVYYLSDGPKRGFVREELLIVPPNTQLQSKKQSPQNRQLSVPGPPNVFVSVRQRLYDIICYPALCIKWRYRGLVHAPSVRLVVLTPQDFHFVHELFPPKKGFFVVLVRYLFLNQFFFHPFRIFGLTATTSSITSPPHSSFILPKTFLFLVL